MYSGESVPMSSTRKKLTSQRRPTEGWEMKERRDASKIENFLRLERNPKDSIEWDLNLEEYIEEIEFRNRRRERP